ncbi:hypothetical protein G1C97_0481 [Bifidobacterium sp. DSM 109959]|uniref:Uncharacterized protein n=1 Tax=Bifidobacterium olomucense TaxID=2675324 RepID=A0A7Y0HWQ6_9BIFI|nr:hypothetical protein [Bifidobacterium sp. DSM 109959]
MLRDAGGEWRDGWEGKATRRGGANADGLEPLAIGQEEQLEKVTPGPTGPNQWDRGAGGAESPEGEEGMTRRGWSGMFTLIPDHPRWFFYPFGEFGGVRHFVGMLAGSVVMVSTNCLLPVRRSAT